MGRPHFVHPNGTTIIQCRVCCNDLTNWSSLESTSFQCASGRAYLFKTAVNIKLGDVRKQQMTTGEHWVRDVACKKCDLKLGWTYEFAERKNQEYKEGMVILERGRIKRAAGMKDDQEGDKKMKYKPPVVHAHVHQHPLELQEQQEQLELEHHQIGPIEVIQQQLLGAAGLGLVQNLDILFAHDGAFGNAINALVHQGGEEEEDEIEEDSDGE